MKAEFDNAAITYDTTFTHSAIGKLQRKQVYKKLIPYLNEVKNTLEINCGTGEDAIWLSDQNINVLATDISPKMIEIAKLKAQSSNSTFQILDINKLKSDLFDKKFDLVFSNFGGLNCLDEKQLTLFFQNSYSCLSEKGKLILVIMPKNALLEQIYFMLKGNVKQAFRRKKKNIVANVDGEWVNTYYYNPSEIKNIAKKKFQIISSKPIGFFIPPSYLEPFFKNKTLLLKILYYLEKSISSWSILSRFADHYLIVLEKK